MMQSFKRIHLYFICMSLNWNSPRVYGWKSPSPCWLQLKIITTFGRGRWKLLEHVANVAWHKLGLIVYKANNFCISRITSKTFMLMHREGETEKHIPRYFNYHKVIMLSFVAKPRLQTHLPASVIITSLNMTLFAVAKNFFSLSTRLKLWKKLSEGGKIIFVP